MSIDRTTFTTNTSIFDPRDMVAFWTDKKPENVTAGDGLAVFVGAVLWPLAFFGCAELTKKSLDDDPSVNQPQPSEDTGPVTDLGPLFDLGPRLDQGTPIDQGTPFDQGPPLDQGPADTGPIIPDLGPSTDTGDGAVCVDGGEDICEAGLPDTAFPDAGFPDAGFPDAGFPDTGPVCTIDEDFTLATPAAGTTYECAPDGCLPAFVISKRAEDVGTSYRFLAALSEAALDDSQMETGFPNALLDSSDENNGEILPSQTDLRFVPSIRLPINSTIYWKVIARDHCNNTSSINSFFVTHYEEIITPPEDAGFPDAGFPDAGFPDTGFPDAGFPTPDAENTPDTETPPPDAETKPDAGSTPETGSPDSGSICPISIESVNYDLLSVDSSQDPIHPIFNWTATTPQDDPNYHFDLIVTRVDQQEQVIREENVLPGHRLNSALTVGGTYRWSVEAHFECGEDQKVYLPSPQQPEIILCRPDTPAPVGLSNSFGPNDLPIFSFDEDPDYSYDIIIADEIIVEHVSSPYPLQPEDLTPQLPGFEEGVEYPWIVVAHNTCTGETVESIPASFTGPCSLPLTRLDIQVDPNPLPQIRIAPDIDGEYEYDIVITNELDQTITIRNVLQ
ncbi:MAG: hypothetical protein WCV91_05785, partial [Candidatus Margulisiibacteriota bacterium]